MTRHHAACPQPARRSGRADNDASRQCGLPLLVQSISLAMAWADDGAKHLLGQVRISPTWRPAAERIDSEPMQTTSLPEARPRADRFRCGGRESKFPANKKTIVTIVTIVRKPS